MKPKLIIVSTCSSQKSYKPDSLCQLDRHVTKSYEETAEAWLNSIQKNKAYKLQARDLYIGSHWKETVACFNEAQKKGFSPELWVLSAGWGLISASCKICSYSATFAQGKDSIHSLSWPEEFNAKERARKWWKIINKRKNLLGPRSFSELFVKNKRATFFIILSKDYYPAVEQELIELASKGAKLIIIGAGLSSEISSASPLIKEHVLPVSDRFKQADKYLNTANVSLNARLATWLILNYSLEIKKGFSALYRAVQQKHQSLPKMKRRNVIKMTDEEALGYIKNNFSPESNTATKLLKRLRHGEGKSCEQKRFGKLFKQYQNENERRLFNG